MESEKVKEIKKYFEERDVIYFADILTYINELESENERLNECYKVKAYDKLRAENKQLKARIAELEKENAEQYKRIMELEQDLVHADENVFFRECNVTLKENEIKEQALKQFAERLKEKATVLTSFIFDHRSLSFPEIKVLYFDDIDETLKEFLGK